MEVLHGLCVVVILICSLHGISAVRCYSCDGFDTSEDCMNFTDCGNSEACYARADGTSSGELKYTVGCTRDMSALREDYTFCTNVCMEDLCNLNHCNIPISPKGNKVRPPRCLSCELISSPDKCTNLVQCNENELCYVREVTVYGNKRFRLGCMNDMHCTRNTQISVNPGTIIGKRLTVADNTSTSDCSVCCDKDHCNTLVCERNQTSSDGTIYKLKMIGDNSCADKDADSCVAFGTLDADACIKLPKVDEICPKTCGICGHFGWEQWSQWSDYSMTCSRGTVTRKRDCLHQVSAALTQNCTGVAIESKSCNEGPCLHEGVWSHWGAWGQCSLTCASGTKTRVRYCTGRDQIHGGLFCPGDHFETVLCNQQACPSNYIGWWVGVTDSKTEGRWLWTDINQQVNYTYWDNGQPDNAGINGAENCAVFLSKFQYKWNDVGCSERYSVICKI